MATTQSSSPWPENPIPEPVKALILGFYSIVDVKSDNEGVQLADKIFADQGVMKNGAKVSKGRDEIIASRRSTWEIFASRKHTVLRVYTRSSAADDILLLGHLEASFQNGNSAAGEFCARIVVEGAETENPKMSLYEVWADHTPFATAIKG